MGEVAITLGEAMVSTHAELIVNVEATFTVPVVLKML